MKKIEGYTSKKAILYWLENYDYLAANDRPPDAPIGNSGPKAYDGVKTSQLNLLMLNQAIDRLPMLAKACCKARWVNGFPVRHTLNMLDISKDVYYERCRLAVELIYKEINGERASYKALLDKIRQIT